MVKDEEALDQIALCDRFDRFRRTASCTDEAATPFAPAALIMSATGYA